MCMDDKGKATLQTMQDIIKVLPFHLYQLTRKKKTRTMIKKNYKMEIPLLDGFTQHFLFPCIQLLNHFLMFPELVEVC